MHRLVPATLANALSREQIGLGGRLCTGFLQPVLLNTVFYSSLTGELGRKEARKQEGGYEGEGGSDSDGQVTIRRWWFEELIFVWGGDKIKYSETQVDPPIID